MKTTVPVTLPNQSYDITIGENLLDNPSELTDLVNGHSVIIITNKKIAPLYLETLKTSIGSRKCWEYILPDGEEHKNLDNFERISTFMLEKNLDRKTVLIALGGGVVGDLGGFVSACYKRGIHYIQIPTTLLSQVDSSVGGKTGVNHPLGKNMIGAFHQPSAVLSDIRILDSLPEREFLSGIAEIIKYGVIRDPDFFCWLEDNLDMILVRNPETLIQTIQRSCENKRDVVLADEKENDLRTTLNLGHTFGHAIEKSMGYGQWLHGEAVAAGICMAARMSKDMNLIGATETNRIENLFERSRLPIFPPKNCKSSEMIAIMKGDKKNENAEIRLILIKSIGKVFLTQNFPIDLLLKTLKQTEC